VAALEIVRGLTAWAATLAPDFPQLTVVLFDFNAAVTAGFVAALRDVPPTPSGPAHVAAAPPGVPPAPRVPTHQWWWNGPESPALPGKFVPYDYDQNEQLERALTDGVPSVALVGDKLAMKNGITYTVDLARMVQISHKYGTQRAVKRLPLAPGQFPPMYDKALEAHRAQVPQGRVRGVTLTLKCFGGVLGVWGGGH
jgi:hypothetical protein